MNIVFKQHLKIFLKDTLCIEKYIVDGIDKCSSNKELLDHLTNHGEAIAEALEVDIETECIDCPGKDQYIDELQDKVVEWETLDEVRKFESYMEFHEKYNAQQMHDLLS